jgi:hypothetical protein
MIKLEFIMRPIFHNIFVEVGPRVLGLHAAVFFQSGGGVVKIIGGGGVSA